MLISSEMNVLKSNEWIVKKSGEKKGMSINCYAQIVIKFIVNTVNFRAFSV